MSTRSIRPLAVAVLASLALCASHAAFAKGVLRATISTSLNQLDPAKHTIGDEYIYGVLVFGGLLRIDESLKYHGELAERWESSPDLKTWTFHLRKGVRFHHGKEFGSDDVVATFKHVADPATGSSARTHMDLIESYEPVDKHTVRFKLKIPYAGFAELMVERQLKIVAADRIDKLSTDPSGTGPFKFKSFTPGDKLELVRNPDYFEKGLPKLDGVVFRIMPENAARVAALEAGDIDLMWNLPLESIDKMKTNPKLVVDAVPTSTWDGIVMGNTTKPFDDVRVRRAVLLALDKAQLAQFAVFGHGVPTHSPISPRHPYFNKQLSLKQDIPQAKKLLAEAGYPNGFKIVLHTPVGRPTRERMGVAVQQMLRQVGIEVEVQRVPYNRFQTEVSGKSPFYMDGYFTRPSIDTSTYPWYHSTGSWNARMWHFSSKRIDEVLDKARITKDEKELARLYMQFQQYAVEDVPGVIAYVMNFANAYSKKVKGFRTHPYLWLDLRNTTLE
jgi:peptide/nickel transport system substrate-binding protein